MTPHPVVRVACATVGVPVFALSVVVQHNDRDPLPWMAIYGAAALVCGLRAAGVVVVFPAGILTVIATAWMATLVPEAITWLSSDHEAVAFTMKTGDASEELAREAGGLGLVAIAGGLLLVVGRHRRRAG